MQDADSIIIGSGMGGLSTALSLARAGQKVIVFEQHYVPGGWAHSFVRQGFKFSPGVHFLGHLQEGGSGRKVYEGLGVANDMAFFRQNPQGYDYNIVGDHHFKMPAGVEALEEKLCQQYPNSTRGIKRYLTFSQQVFEELMRCTEPFKSIKDILMLPWRTRHIGRMGWWKLRTVLDFYLRDPYVKTHLSLQGGNYGLPPKMSPFVVHAIVSNFCMAGTYYPRGSGAGIVKAFTKNIKMLGGEIRTSAGVREILMEHTGNGKRAIGVKLENGETYYAENIISNADPHKTFFDMVGKEHLSKSLLNKLNKTQYSNAALNLFLVVEKDLRQYGMDSGNIWYSAKPDLDQAYESFMREDILTEPYFPAMFITSPTLKDPVSFDGKHHVMEIIVFANYKSFEKYEHLQSGEGNDAYESFKRQLEDKMLNTMEQIFPGIKESVRLIELGTPVTANHYINTTEGNIYGPAKVFSQVGPFNYKHQSEIENLFLCGAATLSNGITGATNSGIGAAAAVLGCKKQELLQFGTGQNLRIFEAEDDSHWPDWLKAKQAVKQRRAKDLKIV